MEPSFDRAYQSHYQRVFEREDAIDFFCALLAPHVPENTDAQILDVGCGTGLGLGALAQLGFRNLQGIDISPLQIESTRKRGLEAQLVTNTAEWIDDRPDSFDFIIATDVLEHLEDQERMEVLNAIHKALRAGGIFLCTVPNANSTVASRWRYIDLTHQISFTESSLQTLLNSCGFERAMIRGSDPFLIFDPPRVRLKRGLSRSLRSLTRGFRRLELVGELGVDEGLTIPLAVNLLALGQKRT